MADEHNSAIKRKREMTDIGMDDERNTRPSATSPSLQDPAMTSYESSLHPAATPDLSQIDQQLLQHVGENAPSNGTMTDDNDLATKAALAAQQHQQREQQQQGPEQDHEQGREQQHNEQIHQHQHQQQQQQQQQQQEQQPQQQQQQQQQQQPPHQQQQQQPQPQLQPQLQQQQQPQPAQTQPQPPEQQHHHNHQIGPEQVSQHTPQSLLSQQHESKYPPPDASFHNEAATAALAHGLTFADEMHQLSQPGGPLGPPPNATHAPPGTTAQGHTDQQNQHQVVLPPHAHSPHGNTASALYAAREAQSPKPSVGSTEWHSIRKINHKEVERRRREAINEGINEIAKLVPGGEKAKGPILQRAIAYLLRLQSENKEISARWEASNAVRAQAIAHLSNDIHKLRDEANRRGDVTRKWISRCRDAGMVFDDYEEDDKSLGPIGIGIEEDQSSTAAQAAQAAAAAVAAAAQVNQQSQAQHTEMTDHSPVFNTES